MDTNENPDRRRHTARSGRTRWLAITAVVVVAVGAGAGAYFFFNSGDSDESADNGDGGGVVELPQNPSLLLAEEEGVWFVENDGNVTMSDIEVRDGTDVICELGTLAPGERSDCEDARGGDGLNAFGLGPQGQEVSVGAG